MRNIKEQVEQLSPEKKRAFYKTIKEKGAAFNIYPLSDVQNSMWFLYEMDKKSPYYNVPFVIEIRGSLDRLALDRSLKEMIMENTILRTRIFSLEGECFQYFENDFSYADLKVRECMNDQVEAEIMKEYENAFDLERDYPLRYVLLREMEEKHTLVITVHHIFTDGWSIGLFYDDLMKKYQEASGIKSDVEVQKGKQYYEFVQENAERDKSAQRNYWAGRLEQASSYLRLPVNYPRVLPVSNKAFTYELQQVEKKAIVSYAQTNRVSAYSIFLTLFTKLLTVVCNQNNITVGTPILNRDLGRFDSTYGLFVNTVPINVHWNNEDKVCSKPREVNRLVNEAVENGSLSISEIMTCADIKREKHNNPLYQVLFTYQTDSLFKKEKEQDSDGKGIEFQLFTEIENLDVQFDMLCSVIEHESHFQVLCAFREALFSKENIEQICGVLHKGIAAFPEDSTADYVFEYEYASQQKEYRNIVSRYERILNEQLNLTECEMIQIRNFCLIFFKSEQVIYRDQVTAILEPYMDCEIVLIPGENREKILHDFDAVLEPFYYLRQHKKVSEVTLNILQNKAENIYEIIYISDSDVEMDVQDNIRVIRQQYISIPATDSRLKQDIKTIVIELLKLEELSDDENFFHIGCNSIKSVKLCRVLNQRLGTQLNVADIYRYSSLNKLVNHIETQ